MERNVSGKDVETFLGDGVYTTGLGNRWDLSISFELNRLFSDLGIAFTELLCEMNGFGEILLFNSRHDKM